MFELFASNRVGRVGFFAMLLATIAFDFAKSPIEKFIVHQSDISAAVMMNESTPEHPVGKAQLPEFDSLASQYEINQKNGYEQDMSNVLAVANAYKEVQKKANAEGREPTQMEMQAGALGTLAVKNTSGEQLNAAADKSFFDALYIIAALGMTGITLFVLIWMATGRIRDIGWSQWFAFAILAVFFAPLIFGNHMPEWLLKACNPAFLVLMIVIGMIRSREDDQHSRHVLEGPPSPKPGASRPGQFGQRGSR